MKKLVLVAAAFLTLTAFTTINGTWTNDDPHSQLGFTVTHLGIADVSGTINDFDVTIKSTKPDFSDAAVELIAKTNSIDTRVEMRDNHLKSADFFDVEKYPALTFKSTGITSTGKDQYKLSGNLTLHGVVKPIIMNLVYKGTVENPMSKKQTAGFQLTGTIKRSEFGIGDKFPAAKVSDEVRIKADGEFVQ
ncbi:polyisoprenoid-binding protein [Segetibacter sp. 3557_3]|uniref:YceI family protein n=1 Tax=Segetibacter sp. 3557_3 TaxID=2547429 RepID=UPI001058789E|nr:YceI family protein [Segetibacter sp. 3557_3]TDH19981.1 polyisoprenoid-binding protein [Segetibacter sp. 3557_3]